MAVTEVMKSNVVRMRLNVGQDTSGNTKTASVNLGSLSGSASDWSAQKALNIVGALVPCLSNTLSEIEHVQTNTLDED